MILQIVALANLLPADDEVDELDSFMFQTVSILLQRFRVFQNVKIVQFLLNPALLFTDPKWHTTRNLHLE